MKKISISTRQRQEMIDITAQVQSYITENHGDSGMVVVFSPHTTAGITINENADPDVCQDLQAFLCKAVPQQDSFAHQEGNSDAHIKASLVGLSQIILIEKGKLQLGTWQGIFLMEFDGPRDRQVWLKFISA